MIIDRLKNIFKKTANKPPQDVIIPVGGIDQTTGTIYEKIVRPDGHDPIYKEQHIGEDTENQASDSEKETRANRR